MFEWLYLAINVYAAILVVFILHELGHMGKLRVVQLFPFPKLASMRARSRYGGLLVNVALFTGVWYLAPENSFILLVGLVAWVHFISYAILGSFNYEPKIPRWLEKYWVYDDVPNELAWLFVPAGIAALWYLKDFYIPILVGLI